MAATLRWAAVGTATLALASAVAAQTTTQPAVFPPLAQWQHTAWTASAGPPVAGGRHLMRSPDGYLWMSASRALLRFDGVRFTVFDSTNTPAFKGAQIGEINPSYVDADGVMWIWQAPNRFFGYRNGVIHRLPVSASAAGVTLSFLDHDNFVVANGQVQRVAPDWTLHVSPYHLTVPDTGGAGTIRDTGDGLWYSISDALMRHVTASSVEDVRMVNSGRPLLAARDGSLWVFGGGERTGLNRYAHGTWAAVQLSATNRAPIYPQSVHEARDGSVWVATQGQGVLRWNSGVVEQFSTSEGLSSVNARDLWLGEEGAVWVSTDAGLDRIRPSALVAVDKARGLPFESGYLFGLDVDGSIWSSGTAAVSLFRIDGGAIRNDDSPLASRSFDVDDSKPFQLITRASAGGVWVAPIRGGLERLQTNGRKVYGEANGLPRNRLLIGAETTDGSLWLTALGGEFGVFRKGQFQHVALWGQAAPRVVSIAPDSLGRMWAVGRDGDVAIISRNLDAQVVRMPEQARSGISLAIEGAETGWLATTESIVRIRNGHAAVVVDPGLSRLLSPGTNIAVSHGSLWLCGIAGIARLPLDALNAVADGRAAELRPQIFGPLDGVAVPFGSSQTPDRIQTADDGRVWFSTATGLAVADPAYHFANGIAPQPHIEEITLSDVVVPLMDGGDIAPNPDRLSIHFSAPSLGLPERERVEYRLEGADSKWNDGSPPRVATYTQLRPGTYKFHVRAWNEDGVPSAHEATLSFTVLPAWYQAWWFFALLGVAVAASGYAVATRLQRRRDRLARERDRARFAAVLDERGRIARELHDTLLQGFTGITLQLEGVRGKLLGESATLGSDLTSILHSADSTLREAREMVWDMRSSHLPELSLGDALVQTGARAKNGDDVHLEHRVVGEPHRLSPFVETTVLRVGREAIVNALKHARANTIFVTLTYGARTVMLEVRDDGKGCDIREVELATNAGHWGVAGMRERATRAGGTLSVHSAPGLGTRVVLEVPGE